MPVTQPRRIPDRDDLTLGDLYAVKAQTGVDPLNPASVAHGLAAMVYKAARDEGQEVTFEEVLDLPYKTVRKWVEEADVAAAEGPSEGRNDEEEAEGPTNGPGTP